MGKRLKAEEWRPPFLEALRETGNVALAAEIAGIARPSAYTARKNSKEFAEAWDEAIAASEDVLQGEARRRAYEGVSEPVYYKGAVVGHVRKYSDTLLMFLLKAHFPEKYRERTSIDLKGEIQVRTLADVAKEAAAGP